MKLLPRLFSDETVTKVI